MLAGVSTVTLRSWLTTAQQAYADLMMGGKPVSVSYDGKSVTYMQTDRAALESWIILLQRQLGLICARRAIVPYFR
jgi:hypothetical protein